jgi:bifunctional NMN adenylyltransferase/nudix hydrolase
VTLYGSRDSFIAYYSGRFPTQELIPESTVSGTEARKLIGSRAKGTQDFREGVIWATQNRYAVSYTTVDIAVVDFKEHKLLLGRKPTETLFRFVGGFAEPNSPSFEDDAKRELQEETGLVIPNVTYIGSAKVDDWRYRNEQDKIKTLFFLAEYTTGSAQASDDIAQTKWVSLDLGIELKKLIVPEHHMLVDLLLNHLAK